MKFDAIQGSFVSGEISPKFKGQVETEAFKAGVSRLENMMVQPHGGLIYRGGFHYIAAVKTVAKPPILVEFNYKNLYTYILEFGENYIRVYVNKAQVQDGASPYEITTTYAHSELTELDFNQDADTLYITHNNHPPAKLTRTAHDEWVLEDIFFNFDSSWVTHAAANSNAWKSVCWSPELAIFVAVANSGTADGVMTSPDGVIWTARVPANDYIWTSVCWSFELFLFVAVASSGTGNRVMTSPDGITWTARTSAADISWTSVCWCSDLTLFVAVAKDGTGNGVMTSADGVTWASKVSATDDIWNSVCWSPDLSLFVAVAGSGAMRVMTSPDGITWTSRSAATNNYWYGVCWSPELALFVAVATDGTGDGVMTSPDGAAWTLRQPAADRGWESICWSPELSLLVAIAPVGAGSRVMTSPDSIIWTIQFTPDDTYWRSVCWSPELSLFVVVADVGTEDRTMTSKTGVQEWSHNNYPALNWFFEQRHFFAATISAPNGVWASQSGDYVNMGLGTGLDNEGLNFIVKSAVKFIWASPGQELILGSTNAEFKIGANAANEGITPSNIRPVLATNYGGVFSVPIRIDDSVIFLQKGERIFRRLAAKNRSGGYSDTFSAENLTILSDHITKNGVNNLTYSLLPSSVVWVARTDGELIGLTYEPDHKIFGWHRHLLGGVDAKIYWVATAQAIEGSREDEVWAVVSRTIDGNTVYYIEYMIDGLSDEAEVEDSFFVDSGITKTGSQFTSVTDLDHLEGEEVSILGDGAVQAPKTVSGGLIVLDTAVDKVHVGLPYEAVIETLPIEGGNPAGTSQGVQKRVNKVSLRLDRSLGFKLGGLVGPLDEYFFGPPVMGEPSELFTGDTEPIPFAGGFDRNSVLKITHATPLPFNLLAIMYEARTR